jgi:hypothetical protein
VLGSGAVDRSIDAPALLNASFAERAALGPSSPSGPVVCALLPVLATSSKISIKLYRVDDLAPASLGFSLLVDPTTVAPPLLVEPDAPSFPVGLVNDTDQVPPVSPVIGKGPCLDLAMASNMNITLN